MTSSTTEPRKPSRVRQAVVHNIIYRSLSQLATALTYVYMVRMLSQDEFGIYHLFYSIPPVISAVFSFGIANALSRYLPEYFNNGQFPLAKSLLAWGMRLRLVTSILVLSASLIFWEQFSSLFKIAEYHTYYVLFAATVVTHFQCRLITTSLSAYLLQQWSMGLTAGFIIVKLIGYVLVAAIDEFSLWTALVVDLIAYLLWYVGLAWANKTRIPWTKDKASFSSTEKRRVIRYGLYNNFNDIGTLTLNSRTDNLFIAAFMSPAFVGAYAFCTQLESMSQKVLPARFFGTIVRPLIFRLDYKTQSHRVRQYFQFLLRVNYLILFPIFVFIASVPDALVMVVFGGKFIEFTSVLVATFAFSFASGFNQPVTIVAELAERADIILASKIFAIYNILANIVLIPAFGIMGAVVATGSAILFKNTFIWIFVRKVANFEGMGRFFAAQLLMWFACFLLLRTVSTLLPDLYTLLLAGPVMLVAVVISWRITDFSVRDRELLQKLGGRRAQKALRFMGVIQ